MVVIKRSFVYLPAALAIISDKKVYGDEDDHEVDEVQKCILASGAVVAEVLHVRSAPVSSDRLKYRSSSTSSSSLSLKMPGPQ